MDSHDIFKRLTSGVKFSKRKPKDDSSVSVKKKKVEIDDFELEDSEDNVDNLRQKVGIRVKGKEVPPLVTSFDEMLSKNFINKVLRDNINKCHYSEPTPIQMQAIPILSSERRILACAPTGSGKTAAFLVPILSNLKKSASNKGETFKVLIICPTQELTKQTYRECVQLAEGTGLKPHIIKKVSNASKLGSTYSEKFDILVTTPNRLIYLYRKEDNIIKFQDLRWLIIDEADKMFEDGKSGFLEQLSEILLCLDMSKVKVAMFSATYMHNLYRWCRKNLEEMITVMVGIKNTTAEDIEQELVYVGNESGKLMAFRELVRQGLTPPVLVFVQSKERAKELFSELIYDSIFVDVIHADRTAVQRENVVKAFREGKIWVLICTELMGRGIDFKGVQLVVNYDFPTSVISYIHCIGRTGRAGRKGKAVTFFTNDDKPKLTGIGRALKQAGCPVPDYLLHFKKIRHSEKKRLSKTNPLREEIKTKLLNPKKMKFRKKIKTKKEETASASNSVKVNS